LSREEGALASATYANKATPRDTAQKRRRQDVETEAVDDNGMQAFIGIHEEGKKNLLIMAEPTANQFNYEHVETKNTFADNLDHEVQFLEDNRAKMGTTNAKRMEDIIAKWAAHKAGVDKLTYAQAKDYVQTSGPISDAQGSIITTGNKDFYDKQESIRTMVRQNNLHRDDMIGGEMEVDGQEIDLSSALNKDLQREVYIAAGDILKGGGTRDAARAAAEDVIRRSRAGAGGPAPLPGGAGGPMPLAGFDEERMNRTQELENRARALGVADYTVMPEYNADQFASPEEMRQFLVQQKTKAGGFKESGFGGEQAFSIRGFGAGGDEMAIDFSQLQGEGLDFLKNQRGLTFGDMGNEQGKAVAEALKKMLARKRSEAEDAAGLDKNISDEGLQQEIDSTYDLMVESPDKVTELKNKKDLTPDEERQLIASESSLAANRKDLSAARNLQNIRNAEARLAHPEELGQVSLINTGGGLEAISHERAHRDLTKVDKDSSWQLARWRNLSEGEKAARRQALERTAGKKLSETELAQEDAADALATGRMGKDQLQQIKDRAEMNDVSLKTKIKIEPEIDESVLQAVPSRVREAINSISNLVRGKKQPREGFKLPLTLAQEKAIKVSDIGRQLNTEDEKNATLARSADQARRSVKARSSEYEAAKTQRSQAEQNLTEAEKELKKGLADVDNLTKKAEEELAKGNRGGYYSNLTKAREAREKYNTQKKTLPELQQSAQESREKEGKARKALSQQVSVVSSSDEALAASKRKSILLDNMRKAESSLFSDVSGFTKLSTNEKRKLQQIIDSAQAELDVMPSKAVIKKSNSELATAKTPVERQAKVAAAAGQLVNSADPDKVTTATEEIVEEHGDNLRKAVSNSDTNSVLQALAGIENTLSLTQTYMKQLPASQQGGANKDALGKITQAINTAKSHQQNPNSLNMVMTDTLLRNINSNLTSLRKNFKEMARTNKGTVPPPKVPKK
jgi:hypothetical protein